MHSFNCHFLDIFYVFWNMVLFGVKTRGLWGLVNYIFHQSFVGSETSNNSFKQRKTLCITDSRCRRPLQNTPITTLKVLEKKGVKGGRKLLSRSFLPPKFKPYSKIKNQSIGFIVGKRRTSRIESLSVRSITRRSTPNPRPPVGGIPYSSAVM